ncbi:MAG: oligoendopeptidase F [Myxococcota bacterium]|jgi:oligoendopeptidase F
MHPVVTSIHAARSRWPALTPLERAADHQSLFGHVFSEHMALQLAFRRDVRHQDGLADYSRTVLPEWSAYQAMALPDILAAGDELPSTHQSWVARMRRTAALELPEAVPLEAAVREQTRAYERQVSERPLEFRGEATALPVLLKHLSGPDRAAREDAFMAWCAGIEHASMGVRAAMDRQGGLRRQLAALTGFDGVEAHSYAALHRDFDPEETAAFRTSLCARLGPDLEERRVRLGVERLRPWDWKASAFEMPTVFDDQAGAVRLTTALLAEVDDSLVHGFERLVAAGAVDLMHRPHKGGGAFCASLLPSGVPFVFANATGAATDLLTVAHEVGHALHFLATEHQPLLAYRKANFEISEVASIAMEFLVLEHADAVLGAEVGGQLRAWRAQRSFDVFRSAVRADAFQSWLYAQPDPAAADLDGEWARIGAELDPVTDWTGLEAERGRGWQSIRHFFLQPFYFIEYAFATVVAEEIVAIYREDRQRGLVVYTDLLALGGSCGSREALAAVGLSWPMA